MYIYTRIYIYIYLEAVDPEIQTGSDPIVKLSRPRVSLMIGVHALTVHEILLPLPFVYASVRPNILTPAAELVVLELARVGRARGERKGPFPVHGVVDPVTHIARVALGERAFAVTLAGPRLTRGHVRLAIVEDVDELARVGGGVVVVELAFEGLGRDLGRGGRGVEGASERWVRGLAFGERKGMGGGREG